jgi:murein L,D-transpeptidase YafK
MTGRVMLIGSLTVVLALAGGLLPSVGGDDLVPRSIPARARPAANPEWPLVESLFAVSRGTVDNALDSLGELVSRQPDFALARLVYADLLAIKSGRIDDLGMLTSGGDAAGLRHEAQARLAHYLEAPPTEARPAELVQLSGSPTAIIVDVERFRLYLFENRAGRPVLSQDYYISIGKAGGDKRREGDEKRRVGVYRVSSYLPGSKLPDMYGPGAFPIDYPNHWDRKLGRTGSGIWLHGTESQRYSRAPLSSLGCVTLSNADFLALRERVEVGRTPVIVVDGVDWQKPQTVEAARRELAEAVERWRRDWESLDTERYLSHYSGEFQTEGMDLPRFAGYKRRVNQGKKFIRVDLSDVAIYAYPGEEGTVLVEFEQAYESDSFRSRRRKQQFWRRYADGWKIVFEAKS